MLDRLVVAADHAARASHYPGRQGVDLSFESPLRHLFELHEHGGAPAASRSFHVDNAQPPVCLTTEPEVARRYKAAGMPPHGLTKGELQADSLKICSESDQVLLGFVELEGRCPRFGVHHVAD
jgi:hypothetical protein